MTKPYRKKTIVSLIISGRIPRVKCGKKYLIDIDLLQDYLSKCMQGSD